MDSSRLSSKTGMLLLSPTTTAEVFDHDPLHLLLMVAELVGAALVSAAGVSRLPTSANFGCSETHPDAIHAANHNPTPQRAQLQERSLRRVPSRFTFDLAAVFTAMRN